MTASAADAAWMARALRLARLGLYTTDPNPRVGCVLVRDGECVGEGFHRRAGEPHAEVHALRAAAGRARGATAYVTLEPCAHHGRTPPCADALIEAGVARVVIAARDPNPLVAGGGLERLRAAGVAVEDGPLGAQSQALNRGFFCRMRDGRPWVRVKLAMSLDGRTAMADGESRWISGEASRRDVQRWRARSSALLTGAGTVLADDPRLNLRLDPAELGARAPLRQPLRVVVDGGLRLRPPLRLLAGDGGPVLVATAVEDPAAHRPLEAAGAELLVLPGGQGRVSLPALMAELAAREVNELQVEAGPLLCGALLQAGLVDEFVLYMAPHLMGEGARGLFALPGLASMADRVPLAIDDVRPVGRDWRITGRPLRS